MSILLSDVESAIMDFVYRGIAVSTTAERWAGLVTAREEEISGPGYERVRIDGLMSAPSVGSLSNAGQIVWPLPTGDWAVSDPVSYVLICEAYSAGNALAAIALSTPLTVRAGDTVDIAPGVLQGSVGSNLTDAWRDKIADLIFRGITTTESAQRWLGLLRSSGAEVTGGGYTRVRIDDKLSVPVDEGQGLRITNSAVIAYPAATEDWSLADPISRAMIYDAESGAGQICAVPFDYNISVAPGDTLRFEPGALTLSIKG